MIDIETAYMSREQAYDFAKERIKLLLDEIEYAIDNDHPSATERAANELPFLAYCALCFQPCRAFGGKETDG